MYYAIASNPTHYKERPLWVSDQVHSILHENVDGQTLKCARSGLQSPPRKKAHSNLGKAETLWHVEASTLPEWYITYMVTGTVKTRAIK